MAILNSYFCTVIQPLIFFHGNLAFNICMTIYPLIILHGNLTIIFRNVNILWLLEATSFYVGFQFINSIFGRGPLIPRHLLQEFSHYQCYLYRVYLKPCYFMLEFSQSQFYFRSRSFESSLFYVKFQPFSSFIVLFCNNVIYARVYPILMLSCNSLVYSRYCNARTFFLSNKTSYDLPKAYFLFTLITAFSLVRSSYI